MNEQTRVIYEFGGFRLDAGRRVLLVGGQPVTVTPRVFNTLLYFVEHRGELLDKATLMQAVWPNTIVEENSLNQAISTLRRTLGEKPSEHRFILTEPGRGYRFVAEVTIVGERPEAAPALATDAALDRAAEAMAASPDLPARRPGTARARLPLLMIGAVLLAAALGLWFGRGLVWPPSPDDIRVAVLPFDVLGADANLQHFTDGLGVEISRVMTVKQVLAIARKDTEELRGPERRAALARLDVALLLDGTVERDGDKLRVRAHLDDLSEQVTVWSKDFARAASAASALQAEVANRIVDMVRFAVDARRSGSEAVDAATLAAFLRARDLLSDQRFSVLGDNPWLEARSVLRQAVARAPQFSRGYSTLAVATSTLATLSPPGEALLLSAESQEAAERALDLDPNNGEAYLALAFVAARHRGLAAQEELLLKGIEVEPAYPGLYDLESNLLQQVGRTRQALIYRERANALNPAAPSAYARRIMLLANLGRLEDAKRLLERQERLWPNTSFLPAVKLWFAMFHGPVDEADEIVERGPRGNIVAMEPAAWVEFWQAFLDARRLGTPEAIENAVHVITTAAEAGGYWRVGAIETLAYLGHIDAAIEQAERLPDGFINTPLFPQWLWFNWPAIAMRRDPRFIDLAARRTGVVEYWLETDQWPDYCSEPDLPYDCRAEAERVMVLRVSR